MCIACGFTDNKSINHLTDSAAGFVIMINKSFSFVVFLAFIDLMDSNRAILYFFLNLWEGVNYYRIILNFNIRKKTKARYASY